MVQREKSQLLVQEYEKQGGGYKKNEKDEAAKSLEEWGEQNWQTAEGEGQARQDDKTKRYLPEEVWKKLTQSEKTGSQTQQGKGFKAGRTVC